MNKFTKFPHNFHIKRYPERNFKIRPFSYIDRNGKEHYWKFDASKNSTRFNIPMGYCIFYRDNNGILWGYTEQSFSMEWRKDYVHVFSEQPGRYFQPEKGHFIIKTTRKYKDIELLNNAGHHSNFFFREISPDVEK